MTIRLIGLEEYVSLGLTPSSVFGKESFMRLNSGRADAIVCAVADNRIGIVFGQRGDTLCAPWSAPYMSVDTKPGHTHEDIAHFGDMLREELKDRKIRIITPPLSYKGVEIPFFEGFRREGDNIITDSSFHVPLREATGTTGWNRNSRRNLERATRAQLTLQRAHNPEDCYNLIADHHNSHLYHMAMTRSAVMDTAQILPADFWMVCENGVAVAAAYCFRVRHDIVQVINSGDTERGRQLGAMTFMAHALISTYRQQLVVEEGIDDAILDYGPTSVDGVQNEGLFRFKTGFGAYMTPKYTLHISPIHNK